MRYTLHDALTLTAVLFIAFIVTSFASASQEVSPAEYHLEISFDLYKKSVIGTAEIAIPPGEQFTIYTKPLRVTGILLKRQDGSSQELTVSNQPAYSIPVHDIEQVVHISYSYTISSVDRNNLINPEGIILLQSWYPIPSKRMRYQLSATLPESFIAVTEADQFPLPVSGENRVTATFSHPVTSIHFAAAPYIVDTISVRDDLQVHTLFFPEDSKLAESYMVKAKEYINRYEQEIGQFPYSHYVIAANRNPTGLGLPTFTLLGQHVLRLPFIKDTSLGHEILHSWFGNSIDVNPEHGNWCEGLTAYLADHAYRQDKGEGANHRKESILNYLSYVHDSNAISLSEFYSGSHAQPLALARRAVGYSKGMMFFHELHKRLGNQLFWKGIRTFYSTFRDRVASWQDIQDIFISLSPEDDLTSFFDERLSRTDIPSFHLEDIEIFEGIKNNLVRFRLIQDTDSPYNVDIPVRISTLGEKHNFVVHSDSASSEITLTVPARPLDITLDAEYELMRTLDSHESPAVWSQFLGAENKFIIIESEESRAIYQPLLKQFEESDAKVKYDHEITNGELHDANLLILGLNQKASKNLFATPEHEKNGFTLDVRHNPLNPSHTAVLISSESVQETSSVASRLRHYGKYSLLHFKHGKPQQRQTNQSLNGIYYQLEQLPSGTSTTSLQNFTSIVQELNSYDIIYIGERHDSVSDHRLQLRLIEALSANSDLAIGMEMFPSTSQKALNSYILTEPEMTEKEFLKTSRYFDVWQYDFRYFREVFSLARSKSIPIIGLNLEREIVSSVYKTGGTDDLSPEIQTSLPQERNLDMEGYGERLIAMHAIHKNEGHGSGLASGFIQAQAIWDETMALNIANYLRDNPGKQIVVLAGSQHTRKDSGIPPRVARRIAVKQATVLNISEDAPPSDLISIADFVFFSSPMHMTSPAMMGVILDTKKEPDQNIVQIIDFSSESKAPEAGLLKGDIIRALNGHPISTMEDIRIAMLDSQTTGSVNVMVERDDADKKENMEFTVELIYPSVEKPHP